MSENSKQQNSSSNSMEVDSPRVVDAANIIIDDMDFQTDPNAPLDVVDISSNPDDVFFDTAIGYIEDILIEPEFQQLQESFMDAHYKEFNPNSSENKLEYMQIHKNYVEQIETYIDRKLKSKMSDFHMERFGSLLAAKSSASELEGDVFDVLLSFSDFSVFKELILDYRSNKEGRVVDLCVMGLNAESLSARSARGQHPLRAMFGPGNTSDLAITGTSAPAPGSASGASSAKLAPKGKSPLSGSASASKSGPSPLKPSPLTATTKGSTGTGAAPASANLRKAAVLKAAGSSTSSASGLRVQSAGAAANAARSTRPGSAAGKVTSTTSASANGSTTTSSTSSTSTVSNSTPLNATSTARPSSSASVVAHRATRAAGAGASNASGSVSQVTQGFQALKVDGQVNAQSKRGSAKPSGTTPAAKK